MSMIKVDSLTFAYPTSYDNIFENVSFQIDTDWRLGFVGRNGRGKTTFLQLLLGKYEYSGHISAAVSFDYFPYEVADKNRLTVDILQELCSQAAEWELIRELAWLQLGDDVLWRPFATLSYGEQTKALLAALFLKPGNFLLLDEPTNHLDIAGREALEQALRNYDGAILAISHDRYFINALAEKVAVLENGRLTEYCGGWEYYLEKRGRAGADTAVEPAAGNAGSTGSQGRQDYQARKEQAASLRKMQNRLQRLEQAISDGEAQKADLEKQLAAPELASDYQQASALHNQLQEVQQQLDDSLNEWEELALALEEMSEK